MWVILGTGGCLAASLPSTPWTSAALSCHPVLFVTKQKHVQTLLLSCEVQSYPWLGTPALRGLTPRILPQRQVCWCPHCTDGGARPGEIKLHVLVQSHSASVREGTRTQSRPRAGYGIPLTLHHVGKYIFKAQLLVVGGLCDVPFWSGVNPTHSSPNYTKVACAPFPIFSLRGSFYYKMVPFFRLPTALLQ